MVFKFFIMILPPVKRHETVLSSKVLEQISREIYFTDFFKGSHQELYENSIKLTVAPTMKSWGEIVDIELIEDSGELKKYKLTSRPRLATTIVDWGKGQENMDALIKIIKD